MHVKRVGKSLESCSQGFFYKVVGSDKTRVYVVDNNGTVIPVRLNSKHWAFDCDVDMTKVGSKHIVDEAQLGNSTQQPNTPSQLNSSDDSFMQTTILTSLLI